MIVLPYVLVASHIVFRTPNPVSVAIPSWLPHHQRCGSHMPLSAAGSDNQQHPDTRKLDQLMHTHVCVRLCVRGCMLACVCVCACMHVCVHECAPASCGCRGLEPKQLAFSLAVGFASGIFPLCGKEARNWHFMTGASRRGNKNMGGVALGEQILPVRRLLSVW